MIRVFKNDIIHIVTACLLRYCVYMYKSRHKHNITHCEPYQYSAVVSDSTFNTELFSLYQIVKNTKSNV